ncbi:MAG: sulfatase [Myxococcales bacterium]|nr:sulfatase [Myxococcales bacterium]
MQRPSLSVRLRAGALHSSAALALSLLGCEEKQAPTSASSNVHAETLSSAVTPAPSASAARLTPESPTPARPYNVVLIYVDSLRADMPWSGYPRDIAPNLTRFAKSAVWYENAYSLSSYTAKSIPPSLIGGYPSELERDGYFFTKWSPENLFLAERIQKKGHRTLAGHVHGYFQPRLNMGPAEGVDDYRMIEGHIDLQAVKSVTDERLAKLAKQMLADPKNVALPDGKRFFGVFHFLDPHHTYERHKEESTFGNKPRDLYDGEVRWTDRWVGQVLDFIDEQPWSKQTVVIVTADHGEGFGEHNHFRHAYELWESLVRVPFLFRIPGVKPRKLSVARGHIDLAPTIADLMGVRAEPAFRGVSLVEELFGGEQPARPVVVDLPRDDLQDRRRAVIDSGWKLISFGDDRRFQLFHLAEDPGEERELSKSNPEQLERMQALLKKLSDEIPTKPVSGGVSLKGAPPGRRY